MVKVIYVPFEEHLVEPTKSNKYWLGYFSKSYEQFLGVSTTIINRQFYTLEEQMERYSRNLAYWYIQLETLGQKIHRTPKHIEPKETFIISQIKRLHNTIEKLFQPDIIPVIKQMAADTKKHVLNGNEEYFTPKKITQHIMNKITQR